MTSSGDPSDGPSGDPRDSTPENGVPDSAPTRRSVLRGAGLAAAGVVGGGIAGGLAGGAIGAGLGAASAREKEHRAIRDELGWLPPRHKPGFDHLIVVMFENRSFDNLLGYLYDEKNLPKGATFEGLAFGEHGCADPLTGGRLAAHPYQGPTDHIMSQPAPDPGEEYPHVNTQLFGTVDPASNAGAPFWKMTAPFNAPADQSRPSMDGFVTDYINTFRTDHDGRTPGPDEYGVVMGSFTPDMLPVLSTLARDFAVYDNWHCAVPSQTFCNRSFFHASTSHGYVTNRGGGFRKWFAPDTETPTIFNRLEEAGRSWCVYFDDRQLISLTGFIHATVLEPYWKTNFRTMTQFYDDVASGNLPDYAFVEPRMVYDHNDMHPPVGPMTRADVDGELIVGGAISDVRAGERLLHDLYQAVRSSSSPTGSNAMNTMLLVTFDEHGGTYDHVPPPTATPPRGDRPAGHTEMDFGFDRLGVRVPAIAISAYTAKGSIINEQMHHGSVIATLCDKYGLDPLTARDDGAPTIQNAVNLGSPRQPATWPQTQSPYLPPNPESADPVPGGDDDRPLSPPGIGLVGMLIAHYGGDESRVPHTYREAFNEIDKHGRGLFGSRSARSGSRGPGSGSDAPGSGTGTPAPSSTP
jgi:phospholipase C